jgi:hypothetical protein
VRNRPRIFVLQAATENLGLQEYKSTLRGLGEGLLS